MVTETKSASAELLAKVPVLLAKVVNDLQLALIHPPGNGDQQKAERVENSLGFQSPDRRPWWCRQNSLGASSLRSSGVWSGQADLWLFASS